MMVNVPDGDLCGGCETATKMSLHESIVVRIHMTGFHCRCW